MNALELEKRIARLPDDIWSEPTAQEIRSHARVEWGVSGPEVTAAIKRLVAQGKLIPFRDGRGKKRFNTFTPPKTLLKHFSDAFFRELKTARNCVVIMVRRKRSSRGERRAGR